MRKYECEVCGYIYDPEIGDPDNGIAAGTPFEDLPEDWAVSYTHLTLPTILNQCRSRWSPYH